MKLETLDSIWMKCAAGIPFVGDLVGIYVDSQLLSKIERIGSRFQDPVNYSNLNRVKRDYHLIGFGSSLVEAGLSVGLFFLGMHAMGIVFPIIYIIFALMHLAYATSCHREMIASQV